MGIIFYIFLLLLIASAFGPGKKNSDFLSRDMTSTINGYFLTTVFMTHFIQYLSSDMYHAVDWQYIYINRGLGQLIVAMFLFYSGYGVMESIKHKPGYIKSFPVKRILLLFLDFEIAAVIYLFISCITGNTPTFRYAIKAFFAWESLGNSNWYVFAILYLYIATYLSFRFFSGKHQTVSLLLVLTFTFLYMAFMEQHKGGWWYDTAMCYVAGMFFSRYKNWFRTYICCPNQTFRYICNLCVLTAAFGFVYPFRKGNVCMFELLSVIFAVLVVALTAAFRASNPWYSYIGKNLFCFYIYQRIPMILFKNLLGSVNIYLYFIVCVLCTVGISLLMIRFYSWLHKKYFHFFHKYLPDFID